MKPSNKNTNEQNQSNNQDITSLSDLINAINKTDDEIYGNENTSTGFFNMFLRGASHACESIKSSITIISQKEIADDDEIHEVARFTWL